MKTREEAIKIFSDWLDRGDVGTIFFYHAPNAEVVDCIVEQVIKIREMPHDVGEAFKLFMKKLGVERGEVFCNREGEPDRIRLTRGWDG
jgi:hypothetical protein